MYVKMHLTQRKIHQYFTEIEIEFSSDANFKIFEIKLEAKRKTWENVYFG